MRPTQKRSLKQRPGRRCGLSFRRLSPSRPAPCSSGRGTSSFVSERSLSIPFEHIWPSMVSLHLNCQSQSCKRGRFTDRPAFAIQPDRDGLGAVHSTPHFSPVRWPQRRRCHLTTLWAYQEHAELLDPAVVSKATGKSSENPAPEHFVLRSSPAFL